MAPGGKDNIDLRVRAQQTVSNRLSPGRYFVPVTVLRIVKSVTALTQYLLTPHSPEGFECRSPIDSGSLNIFVPFVPVNLLCSHRSRNAAICEGRSLLCRLFTHPTPRHDVHTCRSEVVVLRVRVRAVWSQHWTQRTAVILRCIVPQTPISINEYSTRLDST